MTNSWTRGWWEKHESLICGGWLILKRCSVVESVLGVLCCQWLLKVYSSLLCNLSAKTVATFEDTKKKLEKYPRIIFHIPFLLSYLCCCLCKNWTTAFGNFKAIALDLNLIQAYMAQPKVFIVWTHTHTCISPIRAACNCPHGEVLYSALIIYSAKLPLSPGWAPWGLYNRDIALRNYHRTHIPVWSCYCITSLTYLHNVWQTSFDTALSLWQTHSRACWSWPQINAAPLKLKTKNIYTIVQICPIHVNTLLFNAALGSEQLCSNLSYKRECFVV